jgi:trans-aconitate methyltransferase
MPTAIVADCHEAGSHIADIGCGSGQVEEKIFAKCPTARIFDIDSSAATLAIAQRRALHSRTSAVRCLGFASRVPSRILAAGPEA